MNESDRISQIAALMEAKNLPYHFWESWIDQTCQQRADEEYRELMEADFEAQLKFLYQEGMDLDDLLKRVESAPRITRYTLIATTICLRRSHE